MLGRVRLTPPAPRSITPIDIYIIILDCIERLTSYTRVVTIVLSELGDHLYRLATVELF